MVQLVRFTDDPFGNLEGTDHNGQPGHSAYHAPGWFTSRREPEEGLTTFGEFTALGHARLTRKPGREGTGQAGLPEIRMTHNFQQTLWQVLQSAEHTRMRTQMSLPLNPVEDRKRGGIFRKPGAGDPLAIRVQPGEKTTVDSDSFPDVQNGYAKVGEFNIRPNPIAHPGENGTAWKAGSGSGDNQRGDHPSDGVHATVRAGSEEYISGRERLGSARIDALGFIP